MKKEEKWDDGYTKYENFVLKVLKPLKMKHRIIMTPHTRTLEKLYNFDENSNDFIRTCLEELAENFY
jgi:predicted DNA-binding antitoxin AbrB/MazE fold protein